LEYLFAGLISLIGTGSDELCGGREAVKKVFLRKFEEATANRFEWHWSHIIVSGDSEELCPLI